VRREWVRLDAGSRDAFPSDPPCRIRPVTEIFVDGDACPVKDEVYAVAARLGLAVVVVANQRMKVPEGVEMIVVPDGPDAADDWIAEEIRAGDVVVTADIPLAARCLEVGSFALGTNGREFTPDAIGGALATREIKSLLRESGEQHGGPPPISARDRSRFSNELDRLVHRALRGEAPG
jgi:uncharacterized protein YaiI (UPF0178 family)